MPEEDPLEDLYVDKDSLDRERLSKILKKFVGIDKESGEPHFREPYHNLSNKDKLTAYLLYRRAAELLGQIDSEEVGVSSRELSEKSGVNYNTTRGVMSKLNHVKKDKSKGGHYIPDVYISSAMKVFEDE